jgi:hypothetical protein
VIFQRVFEFPFPSGIKLSVEVLEILQWQVLGGFPVEEEEASTHLNTCDTLGSGVCKSLRG